MQDKTNNITSILILHENPLPQARNFNYYVTEHEVQT